MLFSVFISPLSPSLSPEEEREVHCIWELMLSYWPLAHLKQIIIIMIRIWFATILTLLSFPPVSDEITMARTVCKCKHPLPSPFFLQKEEKMKLFPFSVGQFFFSFLLSYAVLRQSFQYRRHSATGPLSEFCEAPVHVELWRVQHPLEMASHPSSCPKSRRGLTLVKCSSLWGRHHFRIARVCSNSDASKHTERNHCWRSIIQRGKKGEK